MRWEPIQGRRPTSNKPAEFVEPAEAIDEINMDPADNRVLKAALAGNADAITSGGHHLLDLQAWRGIRIHDPAALLQLGGV